MSTHAIHWLATFSGLKGGFQHDIVRDILNGLKLVMDLLAFLLYKNRLVQLFYQGYWLSPTVVIIKFWTMVHSCIWA